MKQASISQKLIEILHTELSKNDYIVIYLSDSKLTPRWFYKGILDQLGLESKFYRGDSKRQLQQQLEIIRGMQKRRVVCILDEAHLLEKETLEEFRFLLNYKFDSVSPMAVVLVGQTELWDNKLKLQRYAAIRQRIDMYCTLPHLDRAETEKYIRSHLKYAGCAQEVFTDQAVDEIHKISAGIPRMINRICEKSLMTKPWTNFRNSWIKETPEEKKTSGRQSSRATGLMRRFSGLSVLLFYLNLLMVNILYYKIVFREDGLYDFYFNIRLDHRSSVFTPYAWSGGLFRQENS